MKKVLWTSEEEQFLKDNYQSLSNNELSIRLNRTLAAIKTKRKKLGIANRNTKKWTANEHELLKIIYPDNKAEDIAKFFNTSISSIHNQAHRLGLKKSETFISTMGKLSANHPNVKATWYKKGHTPANKGRKQTEFMSAEAIEKTAKTRFKKGHIPKNHKEVGYERENREGYIEIKVSEPNVFKLKHRLIWEQHNGKIPKGYNIQFKDGNRKNCDIENLYLISRRNQIRENYHDRYPEEIKKMIQIKGVLQRQINKKIKSNE